MISEVSVESGRIFISGKETVDPILIGYAFLDAVENGFHLKIEKVSSQKPIIENYFSIRDMVYLKHDIEQKPRMITAIVMQENGIMYELISGCEVSNHFGFEIQTEKQY